MVRTTVEPRLARASNGLAAKTFELTSLSFMWNWTIKEHYVLQYEAHHPRGGGHQNDRQTWTRTIEADLRPLNIGIHTA